MLASIAYKTFPSFHVGPITVRTFGLMVALGMLLGSWVFLRYARDHGMDPELLSRFAWRIIIFGLIGSRVLFVLTHISQFTDDPLSAFAVWQGGLQFSGAFLVAVGMIRWFLRKHPEIDGRTLADAMALGLVPGLMVGRIGCISVGEHLGKTTNSFLGWRYMGGATREPIAGVLNGTIHPVIHNTAIYELILLAPLTLLMFWVARRKPAPGWVVVTFLFWYGIERFLTDFLRAYDETKFGLTGAQYICIGMVAAGIVMLVRIRRSERTSGGPEPEPAAATI